MGRGDRFANRRLRRGVRPVPEALEGRELLTASLGSINPLTVPSQQGYVLPLDGSGTTDPQTFTITRVSGSADIAASIPQGDFWTINVNYQDPNNSSNSFSGALVFQLFSGLTPNTVKEIEQFTNDGYYTGKNFIRITNGFPTLSDYIAQGGASASSPEASSGQTGTPFDNENLQQLAFTGTDQLAMANAGYDPYLTDNTHGVNTNDAQFFVTATGSPNAGLGYGYTIFGQLVAGQSTLTQITKVPVTSNPVTGDPSFPLNPVVMSSLSLSPTNPNGVAIIDTTQAKPGETATFQVTATDSVDHTTATRTFTVTVGPYTGPADPGIDFKPFATPGSSTVAEGSSTSVTLAGQAGYPDPAAPSTLSYAIVTPPAHGTVTNFNATTGQFDYTPAPGYSGPDSLQFQVMENGPAPPIGYSYFDRQYHNGPATTTTSNPALVTFNVTPTPTTPTPTPTTPTPTPTTPTPTPTTPNPTPTTPNPTPTSSPTPTPTPPPPPVAVVGIVDMTNRRHRVTSIQVTFSGALDFASANSTANYQLIKQGKHHAFLANRHAMIAIASASYDPGLNRVTLVPRKPFVPGKPVEIVVLGGPATGVYDAEGRLIEGNATGIITRRGVTLG